MPRYFAEIQYNGTIYHGWQRQPEVMTVQEKIEICLNKLLKEKIFITGCGRTDTGVHASQYFFHFNSDEIIDCQSVCFKLNCMAGNQINFRRIFETSDRNHARFTASIRSYYYHISLEKNPFLINKSWFYPFHKLDVGLMQKAAKDLMNYNDFPMFCKKGSDVNNYICTLYKSELIFNEKDKTLEYYISANRFLRNMIRRIMGTLIEIGRARLSLKDFNEILKTKRELDYIFLAPPDGLYLSKVEYPFLMEN